jgi:hypothetical protein
MLPRPAKLPLLLGIDCICLKKSEGFEARDWWPGVCATVEAPLLGVEATTGTGGGGMCCLGPLLVF